MLDEIRDSEHDDGPRQPIDEVERILKDAEDMTVNAYPTFAACGTALRHSARIALNSLGVRRGTGS
jgi:hypothetical protein